MGEEGVGWGGAAAARARPTPPLSSSPGLAAGSLTGSALGSRVAVQAPPGALEAAFGVGMGVLGVRSLRAARRLAR